MFLGFSVLQIPSLLNAVYHKIKDKYSIIVCILSVIAVFLLGKIPSELIGGYVIGYELLPINGLITFIGLHFIKKSPSN